MNKPYDDEFNKFLSETTEQHSSISASKQQIRKMLEINNLSNEELEEKKIIYPGMSDLKMLNTFRDLRTKLMQKCSKKNGTIMISSIVSTGGSTYVSQNLAAAFALDFEKTSLLIDCNNENHQDNLLSPEPEYGLTDYLFDPSLNISDIIYSTGIPRLRKTPIGNHRSSSSELFISDRMNNFINEVKNRYPERYIIIDTPPITSSPISRIIAELCDLTVLVVPYGKVSKLQISAGINSIPKQKLAGVVFNN